MSIRTPSTGFGTFFEVGCGFPPYPYQVRLATEPKLPSLLEIPTGLGKTEAVLLAWAWGYRDPQPGAELAMPSATEPVPRRLVWCLPMRALVEQTAERAQCCLARLIRGGLLRCPIAVHRLLGGEPIGDWADDPEVPAVLVGTQDMLLSRALNRGYAASRYRWPREFGLLHNDALWVFDEIQLMGAGRTTSAQLEAFRRDLGGYRPARSLWMSATLRKEWLESVDLRGRLAQVRPFGLSAEDCRHPEVERRRVARKQLERLPSLKVPSKRAELKLYTRTLARSISERHVPGTVTLCILNTVERARALRDALAKLDPRADGPELVLLHSRFRPPERAAILEALVSEPPPGGRVAVCSQVVEAGLDLSSRTLFTELAPWSSLVQRFGRCNRDGKQDGGGRILWCDLEPGAEPPYSEEGIEEARNRLDGLTSAAPVDLPPLEGEDGLHPLLRQRQLLELFDNDADLCGADIDVSPYIRDGSERNLSVFWRPLTDPPAPGLRPAPEELCPVPIHELSAFLVLALSRPGGPRSVRAFSFDVLEGSWRALTVRDRKVEPRLVPGRVILMEASLGGYDVDLGWTGARPNRGYAVPAVLAEADVAQESDATDDPRSFVGRWVKLAVHIDDVVHEAEALLRRLDGLELDAEARKALLAACRWHDAGKAHPVFQQTLRRSAPREEWEARAAHLWAKAPSLGPRHSRRGFRHELASGLAALEAGHSDLVAYLAACHHGKVRLALRSVPGEEPCADCAPGGRFARGIHEHDVLPAADLGGGVRLPETRLDLSCMEMGLDERGRPSWQDRMLSLLEKLGPFRLGYLEALVRVADARASACAWAPGGQEAAHA